ncbi:hypothetical protein [Novosphingopyxis sp.]|uniref:PBECR3 domain-containing polyvalent protein n=1 Tax=Novosphingopyxis sp. TaxID=2709690 RepID=UPI003B5BD70A
MSDAEVGKPEIVALDLGPLPVGQINKVLGLNLVAANAHFSVRAQTHSLTRHPEDFELCRRYVGQIVANPDYVGQAPGQTSGFELIGEISGERAIILVAIKLRVDHSGRYIVASTYPIDRNKLERRLRKGFITPT